MSLTAQDLKTLAGTLRTLAPVVEQLAEMPDITGLQKLVAQLETQADDTVKAHREKALREADQVIQRERAAHDRKLAADRQQLEKDRADIISKAQAEAKRIVDEARKAGKKLEAKHAAALAAARTALE
jgi:vacuolar-type H+-ATPase subunit H